MKYDSEGYLKIFDFGLARDADVNASTTSFIGTPGYMAPELFQRGSDGKVSFTPAVDVYAFGATAFILANGFLPADLLSLPPRLPSPSADFSTLPLGLPTEISNLLSACFDLDHDKRPTMIEIAKLIGLHLLRDRHRALLTSGGRTYVLDKGNRVVQLSVPNQGALTVSYDGLRFVVSNVSGDVAINNMSASNGSVLPGSCVIVLGPVALANKRTIITVDVSHPEVML
jgi:serine/threonine-protein kinase